MPTKAKSAPPAAPFKPARVPNFTPRNSGEIRKVGNPQPKVPSARKPDPQGADRKLYINK